MYINSIKGRLQRNEHTLGKEMNGGNVRTWANDVLSYGDRIDQALGNCQVTPRPSHHVMT